MEKLPAPGGAAQGSPGLVWEVEISRLTMSELCVLNKNR